MIEKGSRIAVKGTFWLVEDITIRSGEIVLKVSQLNGYGKSVVKSQKK
jgi:hypothetical protein